MSASSSSLADHLQIIERQRLCNLVDFDMTASMTRHADDFQLINPMGTALTRDAYLGAIQSGSLIYHCFEPASAIAVRLCGERAAILRYQSWIDVEFTGQRSQRRPYWHTDLYEHRDGGWQIVWSQATAIAA